MNISEYTHDLDIFIKVVINGTQFYRDVNKEMPENAIFLSVLICHSRVATNINSTVDLQSNANQTLEYHTEKLKP